MLRGLTLFILLELEDYWRHLISLGDFERGFEQQIGNWYPDEIWDPISTKTTNYYHRLLFETFTMDQWGGAYSHQAMSIIFACEVYAYCSCFDKKTKRTFQEGQTGTIAQIQNCFKNGIEGLHIF